MIRMLEKAATRHDKRSIEKRSEENKDSAADHKLV
jgi:hypothetical protein